MKNKELTEEFLESKMSRILQTFDQFGVEADDYNTYIEELKENYAEVLKRPTAAVLSRDVLFEKALGKTLAKHSKSGSKFNIFIFRYSQPTDWNAGEMEDIYKAWQSGPKARHNLIEAEKVAYVKRGNEKIVLSKVDKFQISKESKRYVPIAGKEIEEGELPIAIDQRDKINGKDNKRKSYPLEENWNINAYGLLEVKQRYIPFNLAVYDNEYANPSNEKFLPRIAPAYFEYRITASVNEDRTKEAKEGCLFLQYFKSIKKVPKSMLKTEEGDEVEITPEMAIYIFIENGVIKPYKLYKGKANEYPYDWFIVDIGDAREFHDEFIAKRKDGSIEKTPGGYDKTHFERAGIGIYQCTEKAETKTGNYRVKFMDHTGKSIQGFTSEYIGNPPFDDDLPQDALITFQTNKKGTRWDFENKTNVEDPINGDISLGTLMDVKPLKHILDEEE